MSVPPFLRSSRAACGLVLIGLSLAWGSPHAVAAEPDETTPWLVIEVDRPGRLLEHDLVRSVRDALAESPDFRDRTRTPEFERLRAGAELLETALGVEWEQAIEKLVVRARIAAFDPDRPRRSLIVLEADSRESIAALLDALAARVPALSRLAAEASGPAPDKPTVHRLGQAFVTIDGARLAVAGDESLLSSMGPLGPSDPHAPLLRARIDLTRLQSRLASAPGLALPNRNPGAIATVGGWIDRIRRGREVVVELTESKDALQLSATLSSDPDADGPRVDGYFAPSPNDAPRPIRPPGTILSASWYRDYAVMWNDRADLVPAEVVERMEKRDTEAREESRVLGLSRRPSELVSLLGPHYHVLVTRGNEPDYDVPRDVRTPQAAFAVSLVDEEAFGTELAGAFRLAGLIATAQQQMLVKSEPHGEATITSLRFRDDEASRRKGNVLRFQLAPSWTIAHGHFVIGTTREVVTAVLDEVSARSSPGESATFDGDEAGFLSLREAAEALDDARAFLIGQRQLEDGLSSERAETELRVAGTILRKLDHASVRTDVEDDLVRVRLSIGPDATAATTTEEASK